MPSQKVSHRVVRAADLVARGATAAARGANAAASGLRSLSEAPMDEVASATTTSTTPTAAAYFAAASVDAGATTASAVASSLSAVVRQRSGMMTRGGATAADLASPSPAPTPRPRALRGLAMTLMMAVFGVVTLVLFVGAVVWLTRTPTDETVRVAIYFDFGDVPSVGGGSSAPAGGSASAAWLGAVHDHGGAGDGGARRGEGAGAAAAAEADLVAVAIAASGAPPPARGAVARGVASLGFFEVPLCNRHATAMQPPWNCRVARCHCATAMQPPWNCRVAMQPPWNCRVSRGLRGRCSYTGGDMVRNVRRHTTTPGGDETSGCL